MNPIRGSETASHTAETAMTTPAHNDGTLRMAVANNRNEDAIYVIDMKKMKVGKKIVTGEKDKMWKSQYHILNGPYITYEAVTPIL